MKHDRFFLKCRVLLGISLLSFTAALNATTQATNPTAQAAFQNHKEWFAAFLRNTNQKAVLKKAILHNLQYTFPHLWERIQDPDYTFVTALIGVGTGGVEIPLLQEGIKARGTQHNFMTFCEDPSLQMREGFFAAAKTGGVEEQIAEYNLTPFEDPTYTPPQADLAIASHVWYYIKSWRQVERPNNALAKYAHILSERSGVGMIALQSGTSDRYALSSDFASRLNLQADLAGEEIVAELTRLGINHKSEIVESYLNVESCFDEGHFNPNEEGKHLLSFLLRAPWDSLSPNIQEHMKLIFLSKVQENGEEKLILRDCHIWISDCLK